MNVQLPIYLDKPAFLDWVQGREERYELAEGRVVMMPGASRAHGLIVTNLVVALRGQLDTSKWDIIAEFGLDAGPETLRYPDIIVDKAGGGAGDYVAISPALIIEVLSPSSEVTDLGDKAAEYLQLPSLHAYLVLAQNESKAWIWTRQVGEFAGGPRVVSGHDESIRVDALGIVLPLLAIYVGVLPSEKRVG